MTSPGTYEIQDLLKRVAKADPLAYKELFERYYDLFYSTALRYLKVHETAEDLVQHIFLKIWEKREALVAVDNPDGYLFIIARNEILSVLRKKSVDTRFIDFVGELFADENDSPEQGLISKQNRVRIEQAIQTLPPQLQQAYRLNKENGLSYKETAQAMDLSLNTVRGYISSAMQSLRESLRKSDLYCLLIPFSMMACC